MAAIFGGFSEGFDRLWEAHLLVEIGLPGLGALDPVVWFGIIEAGAALLGIGAAEVLRRWGDAERPAAAVRLLCGLQATLLAAVVLFALAGGFALAVAAYWLAAVARGLVSPVSTAWINRGSTAAGLTLAPAVLLYGRAAGRVVGASAAEGGAEPSTEAIG